MRNSTILVIDDEADYLELMKGLLQQEGYSQIITEQFPLKVMPLLEQHKIDLILLDVYMPKMNGMELLEKITQTYPQIPIIMITAVDELEIALKAIKLGAYEYITKPPDTDRLFLTIKRALDQRLLELELSFHRSVLSKFHPIKSNFSNIITSSPLMYKVFDVVEIFSPTNEIILLTGETGTGKDLIAKKIHELSPRRNNPFIVVNLASISHSLFESELFGYEKGSFTGAANEKIGYFETANGGTIFLDEIGELPKELQGKLLRTIQYNEIYRIGSTKPIQLDIRIIAATNKDLTEAVEKNEFRADLFYRLNRASIHLPPLRERDNDVLLLANYFIKTANLTYKKNITGILDGVKEKLLSYSFPGNIRELENKIFNAVAKTKDDTSIIEMDFPKELLLENNLSPMNTNLLTIDETVTNHILEIMNYTGGNVQKAAAILGISERTLQRRLQKIHK
ncbi:MAG TPA: sigma-54 dependent transcriptional regulator [Ignavibacteriaceae bacterium]|nr:sigma-54 dependent transcriptional regulator [Ignavibacteriaceae bacterium]